MSESDARRADARRLVELRTDTPAIARVYDYYLGGKDNFAIDREAAEGLLAQVSELRDYAVGNRAFLTRAVRFLARQGIRQFIDLGTGIPTSPNVHEVAQEVDPNARVVYVDNDPMVSMHSEALMATNAVTSLIWGDLRDVDGILRDAERLLDFGEPVAIMFVATLHHIEDEDDPAGIVARYLKAAVRGSYLVISHFTGDFNAAKADFVAAGARANDDVVRPRSHDEILRLFNGRELIEPGLVQVPWWRPDAMVGPTAGRVWAYGGVAKVDP
jgi:S-adenosyl methyltransferase